MNPARTMGTFLRVWRSEWAGLSRAQLAMAVSAQCRKGKEIKPGAIRAWEDGQPPSSTEELDALLKVMGRHGLTRPEVEQFRRAVFAACVGRQYPECFADEDFVQRRDVDELAAEVLERAGLGDLTYQLPALVTQIGELENEVSRHLTPPAPGTQARKQAVALGYHKASLAHHHRVMGRYATSAAAWADETTFVRNRLGPGAPYLTLEECLLNQRQCLALETRSGAPMYYVLDLHRDATARGQHFRAAWLLQSVFEVVNCTDDEVLCQRLRPLEIEHLEMTKDVARDLWLEDVYLHYLQLALRYGNLEEAETYVEAIEHCQHGGHYQGWWFWVMGNLARAQGNRAEACTYYERGLAVAKARGHVATEAGISKALRECT